MIEINLIPDVKLELIKAKKARTKVMSISILVGVVSIGVVGLLAVYIFGIQTVRSVVADNQINDRIERLSSVTDLSETLTIQNQLANISSLNDGKNIDSRIFDVLGAIIPPSPNNIQISNLSVDSGSDTITIEGQAENGYAAVEMLKKTIAGSQVKYMDVNGDQQYATLASEISTSNTSYGEDSSGIKVLRFTISFVYAQELFAPSSKDVSIVVTVDGNVTDSYLGVPKDIFTERATDITEDE